MRVDPKSGNITLIQELDREVSVIQGSLTTLCPVISGEPEPSLACVGESVVTHSAVSKCYFNNVFFVLSETR